MHSTTTVHALSLRRPFLQILYTLHEIPVFYTVYVETKPNNNNNNNADEWGDDRDDCHTWNSAFLFLLWLILVCLKNSPVTYCFNYCCWPQTLVDVFYWPLVRWFEQQQDVVRAAGASCPVSRDDIDSVFSNVDELIAFSR